MGTSTLMNASGSPGEAAVSLEDEIAQLKAMNAQLEGENTQCKGENARLKGENQQLKGEVAQYKREAYALDKKFQTTKVHSNVDEGPAMDNTPAAHRLEAQARFQSLDINGDGILDALELSAGLCDSGLTDTEIEALFFNLDSNSDNQVSEAEFIDGHHAFIKASQSN